MGYGHQAAAPEAPGMGYDRGMTSRTARGMGDTGSLYPLHTCRANRFRRRRSPAPAPPVALPCPRPSPTPRARAPYPLRTLLRRMPAMYSPQASSGQWTCQKLPVSYPSRCARDSRGGAIVAIVPDRFLRVFLVQLQRVCRNLRRACRTQPGATSVTGSGIAVCICC